MKNIHIATIGHVDHGKSTLLGRLLFDSGQIKPEKIAEVKKSSPQSELDYAHFLDHLEEERIARMTIDVCYIQFKSPQYLYTFIDTPGHKEFIKNMLSGASHAEGAILLVSAAPGEGIQDQTIRHLKLAKLLGINQLLVAINKMDLVGYDEKIFKKISHQVCQLLKKIGYNTTKIPFIPISAKRGINIYRKGEGTPWYQGESFAQALDKYFQPLPSLAGLALRFIIQDIYPIQKEKIVVGKVEAGILKRGEQLIFLPSQTKTTVLEIKADQIEKKQAVAGAVVGLVLKDSEIPLTRGEVAGSINNLPVTRRKFKAYLYLIENQKIKGGDQFLIRCGLREEKAQIKKIFEKQDGFAQVIISTEKPIVIEKYQDFPFLGRFVLIQGNKNIGLGIRI